MMLLRSRRGGHHRPSARTASAATFVRPPADQDRRPRPGSLAALNEISIDFSVITCFPASAAFTPCAGCSRGGVAIAAASQSPRRRNRHGVAIATASQSPRRRNRHGVAIATASHSAFQHFVDGSEPRCATLFTHFASALRNHLAGGAQRQSVNLGNGVEVVLGDPAAADEGNLLHTSVLKHQLQLG